MNNKVALLLAELFLTKLTPSNWAINCIENGYDSKSLRMLASMNSSDSPSEQSQYIERSLKELGWDKIRIEDYLLEYSKILAREIVEGKIDPIKASYDIYQIYVNLDYAPELGEWSEIDEMIWDYEYFLKTGEKGYFYRSKDELISEIKKISKELLESNEIV